MLNSDVSSQMVVFTGHRTRDWSTANSYSMHSSGEDRLTRLYVCMQSAGIKNPDDPTYSSLGDFREKVKTKKDCGAESDGGWPRDYGFLRCIQDNFDADFHQSNVFLKCLDLTEGVMVETIQTPASTLFLGSFNFVALLIASMGIMASFLLFTAGGFFADSWLKTDMMFDKQSEQWVQSGYIYVAARQEWAPLAALPMWLALAWSFFLFGASMFYTFPAKNLWSDIVSIDGGSSALPGTPWTGYMCSGTSLLMTVYFTSCLVEWYGDRGERTTKKYADKQAIQQESDRVAQAEAAAQAAVDAQAAAIAAQEAADRAAQEATDSAFQKAAMANVKGTFRAGLVKAAQRARDAQQTRNPQQLPPGSQSFAAWDRRPGPMQDASLWKSVPPPPPPRNGLFQSSGPGSSRPTALVPRVVFPGGGAGVWDGSSSAQRGDLWGSGMPLNMGLGIRYNSQLHYADHTSSHLTPLLNKAFALTWVFADSLMFVGMLNGQNSPLNENVVAIWYYIIQCRGFQLAAAYFMDDVLFVDKTPVVQTESDVFRRQFPASYGDRNVSNGGASQSGLVQSNIIHAGIAVACSHLASLWCMVIVLYHFINALSIPLNLNSTGVMNPTCPLQIAFVAFHVCMEVVRHVVAYMTIIGKIDQMSYLTIIQVIYMIDWVIRYVFVISTLFTVPYYLGDNNAKLYSYLLSA